MRDEKMFGGVVLTLLAAISLLLNGCATEPQTTLVDMKVTTASCPYQISPLDKAELTFADGSSKELIVSHQGTVEVNSG